MYDLLVIGGGINGTGIARDAAGRGLNVLLCEKDDLAQHTSSASTKLIHGGLRYLEHYDFALVRKALKEREVLWAMAPHIIWPVRFALPHNKDMRPAWIVRLGLFLYDHIGGRKRLPSTTPLKRGRDKVFDPLKAEFKKGFEYSDCWVDDSRLVVLNAVDAARRGAKIMTHACCTALTNNGDHWTADIQIQDASPVQVQAKVVVNASGPWVDDIVDLAGTRAEAARVRLVKGSHIITAPLFEGETSYFFQGADGRIIFAIPYLAGQFTLIGTTDVPFGDNPDEIIASADEIQYLCDCANEYFQRQISPTDVLSTYSGVRPLYDDRNDNASEVTRDYVLTVDAEDDRAPLVSVFGGKITTYRKLAEDVLDLVKKETGFQGEKWTAKSHLPGGDYTISNIPHIRQDLHAKYAWFDSFTLDRMISAYGKRTAVLLGSALCKEDLGLHYGAGLYEAEVAYLIEHEFVHSTEDIIWRRSKLGLVMTEAEIQTLNARMINRQSA